ncbi:class I adenylate-forming enzyme family protein [Hydrogenophaga crocea]|uniref:class I adenylate-forming enzyme family protein n=1 Tax=Hydrogenophaga crocea TaxID=2716225 RepID=UPI00196A8885|nr:AMP-binding protein [Hydrogenophaga crocea]
MKTLFPRDLLQRCARNYPNKAAYVCGPRSATWHDMHQRSERFARALQDMGVRKGETVAVLSQETIEVYEHLFACAKIGAVRVGVNTLYAWPEMHHVLKDSSTRVLLVDARCKNLVNDHLDEVRALGIRLIGFNGPHDYPHDYETLIREAQGEAEWPPLADDDLLLYSYTSGTTGFPKGVMIKQVGVSNVVLHCLASFGFSPDDVWYMPAASAWAVVIMNLFGLGNGMTTVVPDGGFHIVSYLRDIERFRVTTSLIVPTMIQRVLVEIQNNRYDLSSLRCLMYGSSPATPKLIRETREKLGVAMMQTYGQTETSGGWLTVLTETDHQLALSSQPGLLRSVGRVGLHYECSIRDDEGKPLPPNTKGEIWLRGESVMKGYLNLPEATAEALPGDGWLRTNDIGMMDERGYLFLLDRQKFMIITGAVNVFPSTVEAVVSEHPGLEDVAVVGVPHPEWGEAVVAVAVRRAQFADLGAEDVIRFCDGKLSRPETPKHVVFVPELMKTVNGKLRKNDIRAWLVNPENRAIPWDMNQG